LKSRSPIAAKALQVQADACLELRDSYHEDVPNGWLNVTMPGRYRKPQADAAWAARVCCRRSSPVASTTGGKLALLRAFAKNVRLE
jgi:hypothetical protein